MAAFGFIGIGNMGGAIAMAAIRAVGGSEVLVSAKHPDHAQRFAQQHGCTASTAEAIAREAKYVVLGVKPQHMESVLSALKPILEVRTDAVLVTMAAGLTMKNISDMVGGGYPVIRIMPNTPARVGSGMILYDANDRVRQEDQEEFLAAMASAGMLDHLPENLIDAGSAVAGCGPAFVSMFVEALADGGVACGLPRQKAMTYAAQMLRGTVELMMESGDHPGVMKDAVCSPGGSTIQGVRTLECGGLRGTVMEAVIAAYGKSKEFSK